jgi:hypothetical protein
MTGTAVFAIGSIDFNEPTTASQKIRAVGDFNKDGAPDFVWQDETTGDYSTWFMHAALSQSQPMTLQEKTPFGGVNDPNWKIAGSGDFNGDGWLDLLWQNQADGRIWVWKLREDTGLETSPITPEVVSDLNWKIRAVADMNGDDKADLIWQHRVDGRVAVWLMNGTSMVSGIVIAQLADTNWEIVGPR